MSLNLSSRRWSLHPGNCGLWVRKQKIHREKALEAELAGCSAGCKKSYKRRLFIVQSCSVQHLIQEPFCFFCRSKLFFFPYIFVFQNKNFEWQIGNAVTSWLQPRKSFVACKKWSRGRLTQMKGNNCWIDGLFLLDFCWGRAGPERLQEFGYRNFIWKYPLEYEEI